MALDYVIGTDISKWNDLNTTPTIKVDYSIMRKAGAGFTIIKATQGNFTDEDFIENWKNAASAGMPRAAYHFLVWNISAVVQARTFWAQLAKDPGECKVLWVDFEWWNQVPSDALSVLAKFLNEMKLLIAGTGLELGIYTAPGFWNMYGKNSNEWKQYHLWVANWQVSKPLIPKPWTSWTIWQWTAKGDGPTYGCESTAVDLNYVTSETYRKIFKVEVPPLTLEERVSRLEHHVFGKEQ